MLSKTHIDFLALKPVNVYIFRDIGMTHLEQHNKNMSVQYMAIFHGCKNCKFLDKKCDIFLLFAQNIDRAYNEAVLMSIHNVSKQRLENNVYPCKPQFYYIKVGCKGVCLHNECPSITAWD